MVNEAVVSCTYTCMHAFSKNQATRKKVAVILLVVRALKNNNILIYSTASRPLRTLAWVESLGRVSLGYPGLEVRASPVLEKLCV